MLSGQQRAGDRSSMAWARVPAASSFEKDGPNLCMDLAAVAVRQEWMADQAAAAAAAAQKGPVDGWLFKEAKAPPVMVLIMGSHVPRLACVRCWRGLVNFLSTALIILQYNGGSGSMGMVWNDSLCALASRPMCIIHGLCLPCRECSSGSRPDFWVWWVGHDS